MSYIDLVWTGMAVVGGLLLIGNLDKPDNTPPNVKYVKWGIWLIFGAYMLQVFWEFTHPWKSDSLWSVIDVSIIIIFGFTYVFLARKVKKLLKKKQPQDSGSLKKQQ